MNHTQFNHTHKKINDIILIGSLLAAGIIILIASHTGKEKAKEVCVEVDGEETGRYLLSEDGTYSLNGGTNILVIEDGYAKLIEADCPDKLCVKQGRISLPGQCIVCLPNRLTVTARGGTASADICI